MLLALQIVESIWQLSMPLERVRWWRCFSGIHLQTKTYSFELGGLDVNIGSSLHGKTILCPQ